jgi:CHAT domain
LLTAHLLICNTHLFVWYKISLFETQAVSYRILQQVLIAQNQPESALTISEWGRSKVLIERLTQQLNPKATLTTSQAPSLSMLTQIARSQNSTLVEYSLTDEKLYIWVIQPTGKITFRQVDLKATLPKQCNSINQLVNQSRTAIGVRRGDLVAVEPIGDAKPNPCNTIDSKATLTTLHQLLIQPIADLLPTDPTQHVTFIPQDELFLVPFPALLDANGKYLIEHHTIRTASSIQLLQQTAALKATPKGNSALVLGNPKTKLDDLPEAEKEAHGIAPLFNTTAITGADGTKATILQKMKNAKLIHLATHGTFDDRNGLKSALHLTPNGDNGLLTAEEIGTVNCFVSRVQK